MTGGEHFGDIATIEQIQTTPPNQIVTLSAQLVAPTAPGTYTSVWRLQSSDGTYFGWLPLSITVEGMPPLPAPWASAWAGNWKCVVVNGLHCGVMQLTQQDRKVTGTWGLSNTLNDEADLNGTTLSGTWAQGVLTGGFVFTLAADRQSWVGTMQPDHQVWCGWRTAVQKPAVCRR